MPEVFRNELGMNWTVKLFYHNKCVGLQHVVRLLKCSLARGFSQQIRDELDYVFRSQGEELSMCEKETARHALIIDERHHHCLYVIRYVSLPGCDGSSFLSLFGTLTSLLLTFSRLEATLSIGYGTTFSSFLLSKVSVWAVVFCAGNTLAFVQVEFESVRLFVSLSSVFCSSASWLQGAALSVLSCDWLLSNVLMSVALLLSEMAFFLGGLAGAS